MSNYTRLRKALYANPDFNIPNFKRKRKRICLDIRIDGPGVCSESFAIQLSEANCDYLAAVDTDTIRALLDENDKLRAELDRPPTQRPMRDAPKDGTPIMVQWKHGGYSMVAFKFGLWCQAAIFPMHAYDSEMAGWTPIPNQKGDYDNGETS